MKVAILAYSADRGAFATVARNIAVGLVQAGVEVEVVCLVGPSRSPAVRFPVEVRLTVLRGRGRTCWWSLAAYLRRTRPTALVSLSWIVNPAAVVAVRLSRTGTRLILNEGSLLSYKTRVEHRHQLQLRLIGTLARVLYPRAEVVTGASSDIVADLRDGFGLEAGRVRLAVVPNAVDAADVVRRAQDADPDATRTDGPVFVNIARHARQKNIDLLLQAFARYAADGGPGTLVLVGDGPENNRLRTVVGTLGIGARVVFRGVLQNPFPQLAAATAFVLSSEEEGFGLALVEAMVLGLPVISTSCPGGPSEILRGGRDGILVESGDVGALASAMRRIADDRELREELAVAGRRRAEDFSPAAVGKAWLDVIDPDRSDTAGVR